VLLARELPEEVIMSSSRSRRQFLRYSAGTAALALTDGCASRPAPAPGLSSLRGATVTTTGSQGSSASSGTELIVQPTPSLYFTSRDPGSREMNFGPVKDYGDTIPNDRFYIHSRARPPSIDAGTWRLELTGDALGRPRSLTFAQLMALPQVTVRRTLDCGANCRAFYPRLPGKGSGWLPMGFTQWHFGAVGAAAWTGVRLKDVLDVAGLESAVDVMFVGLDSIPMNGKLEPYAQVIPIEKVLEADTLLVHRMNGEPLPVDHGYPVRAIFSGWGGNTAVKWVGRIEVSKQKIAHPTFQARQVIYGPDIPKAFTPTVGHVRSALELDADVTLMPGDVTLRGRAWSGAGAIDRVDVSVEKLVAPDTWRPIWDPQWREAQLIGKPEPMFWVRFELPWTGVEPGRYRVMSRARDSARNVQPRPEDVLWNQQGLGYNGHAPLELAVLLPDMMP
jgi:DMSO/TMAO reductase YedYZ molybdopterin-dependent catalytic subunit